MHPVPQVHVSDAAVVRSERVVLPDGVRPATRARSRDGRIVGDRRVASIGPPGVLELDAGDLVVMPGLVDTHVHINDPGRADWEGFDTATRAAAAGGVTTHRGHAAQQHSVDDHRAQALDSETRGRGRAGVMWTSRSGAASSLATSDELEPLAAAGVRGFKCFMSPSGVDEFAARRRRATLREALPVLAALDLPLLVHAELPALLARSAAAG